MRKSGFYKVITLVILAGLVLSMLAGCASASGKDTSLEDVKKKGYFTVGLDDSFPPMGFRDEAGQIVGFDIDMANEAAKRMGIEARFQPVVWDFIGEELNGKKVDLIWNGCTITEARQKVFDFTKPYMDNKQVVVVLEGSDIQTLADLKGKKAGIQGGSSANIALDSHPEVKDTLSSLNEYADNAKALTDLELGRVEAVFVDATVFGHYRLIKPGTFRMLSEDLGAESFGVGIRKSDIAFKDALQKAIDEMMADGTAQKIADKWFGEGAQVLAN